MTAVTFSISVDTKPEEVVAITGSCPELGEWQQGQAAILERESVVNGYGDGSLFRWSRTIQIQSGSTVQYRFFISRSSKDDDKNHVPILRWETNVLPRSLTVPDNTASYNVDTAKFGTYDGAHMVNDGWLTGQTEIHLRLLSDAICLWREQHASDYYVKCTPVEHTGEKAVGGDGHTSVEHHVTVCNLTNIESDVDEQGTYGTPYDRSKYIIFHIRTSNPNCLAFRLDIYGRRVEVSEPSEAYTSIGRAYLVPFGVTHSNGTRTVQISGLKHTVVGQITVHYLIVKPLADFVCDMSVSYAGQWMHGQSVAIGHRGCGSTYDDTTQVVAGAENTIASLKAAARNGAHYVEFDVQLCKDKVPIVFHDFHVCLNSKKKYTEYGELVQIGIKDLTYFQLQSMQLHHTNKKDLHWSVDDDDTHPFPTLKQCFGVIDEHIGFNIEVKYAMLNEKGDYEQDPFFDRNEYVDIILKDVLLHAANRHIVFSCFDPDICILLRLKQNKYPVLFLTMCTSDRWVPYMDPRTRTIGFAISFACKYKLMGLSVASNLILNDVDLVSKVKNASLALFCWGSDNNDSTVVQHLKKLAVDAIICDRLDIVTAT